MNMHLRTDAGMEAIQEMLALGVDRKAMGLKTLLFLLYWAETAGQITEPESWILTGRKGLLRKYAEQGYFKQIPLPPGLKGAPHFPHEHYFHIMEKGFMFLAAHLPDRVNYGNLEPKQLTYLHDFICRIEAAWRIRTCRIQSFIPESRFPDRATQNQKQHDAHLTVLDRRRGRAYQVGLEVELADKKCGDKLGMFVTGCLNSLINKRVHHVTILCATKAAQAHYAKPFQVGQPYYGEWVKESGRWYPRKATKALITESLARRVEVGLILSEVQIRAKLAPEPRIWLPEAEEDPFIYPDETWIDEGELLLP